MADLLSQASRSQGSSEKNGLIRLACRMYGTREISSLSIVTNYPAVETSSPALLRPQSLPFGALLSVLLTPLSLVILGYHPYAEDGGLYLSGVEYLLDPTLFPHLRQFVTAPLHYSVFAPVVASLIRHSGLSFDVAIFTLFLFCLWMTLFAAWHMARVCFATTREQVGATLLVALWLSLPVAGTSLMLIDPYLTARSVSTPLVLFAVAETLRSLAARNFGNTTASWRHLVLVFLAIVLAGAFHPLMAGYGAAFVFSALWMAVHRPRSAALKSVLLLSAGVAVAAALQGLAAAPSAAVTRASLTRSYWFLSQWEWFEVLGLIAPLLLLEGFKRSRQAAGVRPLVRTATAVGLSATAVSLCFARARLHSFGVAHLQPLRTFQIIYFALLLTTGAWLARAVLRDVWWRWGMAILLLGLPILIPAWLVFPHSAHLEVPGGWAGNSTNRWVEAFRWIRQGTPADALFALDANYISEPDEDAQSFRAIAGRSALPDYSKDGGETSVNPELSEEWVRGVDAQQALSAESDEARRRALAALGVTWMVLKSNAKTAEACPYDNGTVKVCKLTSMLAVTPASDMRDR